MPSLCPYVGWLHTCPLTHSYIVKPAHVARCVNPETDFLLRYYRNPELVASISSYTREHIRRFGRYTLDMDDLNSPQTGTAAL